MNSGSDLSTPRFPKPIDTIITALGIALFIVFTFVGVNQAGDTKAVTGNNQKQTAAAHDEEVTLTAPGPYIVPAVMSSEVVTVQSDQPPVISPQRQPNEPAGRAADKSAEKPQPEDRAARQSGRHKVADKKARIE